MLTYDLIYLSRVKHEEMIAEAAKWSGRAYGVYSDTEVHTENRIAAALKALFVRKPAGEFKAVSNTRTLRTAAK